jgi:hypothetical protein
MARAKQIKRSAPSSRHRDLAGRIKLDPWPYHYDPTPGYGVPSFDSAMNDAGVDSVAERPVPGDGDEAERAREEDGGKIEIVTDDSEDEDVMRPASVTQPAYDILRC